MSVNGKIAKAGTEIRPDDVIEIRFGTRTLRVQVLAVNEYAGKDEAAALYREVI